jgi:tetratricopeptide (TPR) repeat protein
MKTKIYIAFFALALMSIACEKADFETSYADPSKISQTTVEKQFTGFLNSNKWYVLPEYWNYFVVLRTSLQRWNQAVGWVNSDNQYIPPSSGINSRWDTYYGFLAQYRELEKVFSKLDPVDQKDRRIYMIAASIYLYDHTQRVVDLHGDVPWSAAGRLSENGGDYEKSFAKYDGAEAIYIKMLDDLKAFSDELNSITVSSGIQIGFKTQDFLNKGDLNAWKRYCNSLRLRMLTRVSGVSSLQSRANTEIASILADATKYPIVSNNTQNIQINVHDLSTDIHSKNFRSGLEDWDGNVAGKVMIDHMKKNADPRLRALFEPGVNAKGEYLGLDPMLDAAVQTTLVAGGTLSLYNRSTLSRNQFFPGVVFNAAEVSLLLAEYYLKANNDALAKTAYENAIKQSIEFYYNVRKISNDNTAIALVPTNDTQINDYITSADVNWATNTDKLKLIATQKWIHFNVIQPVDSWAEIRRLDLPKFTFRDDPANTQKQPPLRWFYPNSESIYNNTNYSSVVGKDNLSTRIFWDTK